MSDTVLVIMEQRGGAWNRMSFETLAAGQRLASELGDNRVGRDTGAGNRCAGE